MMEKDQAYIDIDIQNNGDILRCILDTIPYMEGWIADPNAENFYIVSHCPRFFRFFISEKKFSWLCGDEGPLKGGTLTLDPMVISDMAQISELLEFVNHAASQLVNPKTASEKLNEQFKKFFGSQYEERKDKKAAVSAAEKLTKYPSLMDIVQVQPMAQPSAKVFYMDYVYGDAGSGKTNASAYINAKAVKKAAQSFADAAEKSKKEKLYKEMAKEVQEEIDSQILNDFEKILGKNPKEEIKKWESETLGSWDNGLIVDPPYGLSVSPEFKENHKAEIIKAKEFVSHLHTLTECEKTLKSILGLHDAFNEILRMMVLNKIKDIKDSMEIMAANLTPKEPLVKINKKDFTYKSPWYGYVMAPAYPKWET